MHRNVRHFSTTNEEVVSIISRVKERVNLFSNAYFINIEWKLECKRKPLFYPQMHSFNQMVVKTSLINKLKKLKKIVDDVIWMIKLQIQPKQTVRSITYVCTEPIFDSRLFMYNKIFLEKLL